MSPQTSIAHYRITAKLGEGGMGEVWRATDTKLGREVAIKILPDAFANDTDRLARFQREAQVLASLNHPNIASIYGVEERALVMELVEGPTLAERIAEGPIPLDETLIIIRQVAEALEYAHDRGIVHRDLKPSNIKIDSEGCVKVLDFGLAKVISADAAETGDPNASPTVTMCATAKGVIMGTAAYMSPEQARGRPVDRRADIWAFGAIFLEMLTGRAAFAGDTLTDTLAAVLRAEIDWKGLPPGAPPAVRRLIARCVERDLKRRLRDIGDAWIEVDVPPASETPPPARALPWIVAGAAVVIGLAGVAWALLHKPSSAPHPVTRWTYSLDHSVGLLALSRDGSRLAFSDLSVELPTISVRMMDQLEAKPLGETANSYGPAFSPDGQWIAFISYLDGPKLKKIPVTGGAPVTICEAPGAFTEVAWGDDGNIIFGGPKGLMRVSSSGGTPEALTSVDPKRNETGHVSPNILPGGQAILFAIETSPSSAVAVLDLNKHTTRVLVQNGARPRYVSTGHLIYYRSGALFATPFNAARLEIVGPEASVVEGVSDYANGSYAVSENGLLVYLSRAEKSALSWAGRKGATEVIGEPTEWGSGRLSPDGSRIVMSVYTSDNQDIWIYDSMGHSSTRLTFDGQSSYPIWSPDSRWITFIGIQRGNRGIYRIPADGGGKPELLLATLKRAFPHSWSPDGKTLVYSEAGPSGYTALWALTIPGGKPIQLHEGAIGEGFAEVSPDGHWLAYVTYEAGRLETYLSPFPGPGPRTRIGASGPFPPRWSRDGKELFYWEGRPRAECQLMAVEVQRGPILGASHPLFKLREGEFFDVAPDGKRFLVEILPASVTHMIGVENWFDELNRLAPLKK